VPSDDLAKELRSLERLVSWMDDRFRVPGTTIRFGLDPILGLLPGIGDSIAAVSGVYMLSRARKLGVPRSTRLRMVMNVILDTTVGTVPLIGNLFDVGFKANRRNLILIQQHVLKHRDRV
jgi:hypothetical protein